MWWEDGNTLALVDAIRKHARQEEIDASYSVRPGRGTKRLNSGLVGIGRAIGMTDEEIRKAFESDRNLTIYEP